MFLFFSENGAVAFLLQFAVVRCSSLPPTGQQGLAWQACFLSRPCLVAGVAAAVVCRLWTLIYAELDPQNLELRPQVEIEFAG